MKKSPKSLVNHEWVWSVERWQLALFAFGALSSIPLLQLGALSASILIIMQCRVRQLLEQDLGELCSWNCAQTPQKEKDPSYP